LEIFFDDILSFLNAEIDYILLSLKHFSIRNDNGGSDKTKIQKGINKIRWTANNIDLVELIYALYHSKSLNDGNINIKVIVKAFEVFFDVKLGNHYRTYVDITRRKINRSKFLCNLLRVIEDKFIETDRK